MAVPDLSPSTVDFLAQHGIHVVAIDPLGARVSGLDLRAAPSPEVLGTLEAPDGPRMGPGWAPDGPRMGPGVNGNELQT
jgi:hypothetical protein